MSKDTTGAIDENKLIAERRGKLSYIREQGEATAFPNNFRRPTSQCP